MKKNTAIKLKSLTLLPMLLFLSIMSWAQDKKVDVSINTKPDSGNFFTQPWVWVVGIAVFIIIIVALMRGKSNN